MSRTRYYLIGTKATLAGLVGVVASSLPALAGMIAPAPLAGVLGPYGMVAAGLIYGGYRLAKHLKSRH